MTTSWIPPRPDLRASDADRERVVAFLRDQSLVGRLDAEELDERIGAAYAAKTVRELQALLVDLPGSPLWAPPRSRPVARPARRRSSFPTVPLVVGACALLLAPGLVGGLGLMVLAMCAALVGLVFVAALLLSPLILVAAVIVAATRRRPRRSWGPPRAW